MLGVLLAGVLIGMAVSAPIGPMAMVTALRWAEHHHREATLLAFGVAAGDFTLAALAALVFLIPDNLPHLPQLWLGLVAAAMLFAMSVYTWIQADQPVHRPLRGNRGFWAAIVLTMSHPGNVAAMFALYASVVPAFSGYTVGELNLFLTLCLLAGVASGVTLGWIAFLSIVAAAVKRYGKLPNHLRMWLARAISLLLALAAAVVLAEVL